MKRAVSSAGGLAVLALVAVGVRLPGLTTHGLYRDDAWPALSTKTDLFRAMRFGVTVPGFEVFLRAWLSLGRSTRWAQLPMLAASVAGVVFVYLLARRLRCGRAAATVAAGVLALSPVSVLYATRVKQYSFDALGTLLLITGALAVAARPQSRRRWLVLLIAAVGAAWFSASLLPMGATALAYGLVPSWKTGGPTVRRIALGAMGTFAVFAAAYGLVVLRNVPRPLHDSWTDNFIHPGSPGRLVASTLQVLDALADGVLRGPGSSGPLLLLLVVVGAIRYRRDVGLLLAAPLLLALLGALTQRVPLGGGRTDAYLYPCVALSSAMAFQSVLDLARGHLRQLVPELAVLTAIVAFAWTGARHHMARNPYPAADIGPLMTDVRQHLEPGDAVVVSQFSRYPYALYAARDPTLVFSRRYATGMTVRSTEPDVFIMPAEFFEEGYDPDAAVEFAGDRRRVWYVATDTPPSDTPPAIQALEYEAEQRLIDHGFRIVRRLDAYGVHADLLVRP
jgi:hypothetical protein